MIDDDEIIEQPDVVVEGRYPELTRVKTGLVSLDLALSHKRSLGMPMRVLMELYGPQGLGKSTLGYYLAGVVAAASQTNIAIADVEMADLEYIARATFQGGFHGRVKVEDIIDPKGKPVTHERLLNALARDLMKEEYGAALWDSVGGTIPSVEMASLTDADPKEVAQFGEAFMGRKAKFVSQVVMAFRTALITKATPSTVIAINHQHRNLGVPGSTTTGGERLKYLAGIRTSIWRGLTFKLDDEDPDSLLGYLVYGQMEKMRFGGGGRQFQYYVIPGIGVHPGVTAMFDALEYGLAEQSAGRIKVNGRSLGFLKKDLLAYALEGGKRKFYPFQEMMSEYAAQVESGDREVRGVGQQESNDEDDE